MQDFNFYIPTQIVFGKRRMQEVNDHIDENVRKILIVTDKNIATQTDAVDTLRSHLIDRDTFVFTDVEENPSLQSLEKGKALALEHGIQCIIGLGGGSPMDAAKGIAVLATNPGSMTDYMRGTQLSADPLPAVCIPTTSGTGSEVTPYAVFTDVDAQTKGGYAHPQIFPRVSIVDPEVTYTMPESVIVNTGLDALTHAIEAYLSLDAFPMSDVFALESIRIALELLPQAAKKDPRAMDYMAYASMLAGVAITHGGTILLHIMGYPLTVFHGVPHGLANAALLPEFMRFMREKSTVTTKVTIIDTMFNARGGIEQFVQDLGVSTSLSSYGIQEKEIDTFVSKVIVKGDVKITPAEVSEEAIAGIFKAAL